MNAAKFQELLARAKANLEAAKEQEAVDAATALESAINDNKTEVVDTTNLGISNKTLQTDAGQELAVDAIREVVAGLAKSSEEQPSSQESQQETKETGTKTYGVAKTVTLNAKQQEFLDAVIAGDDVVLMGAAGTGKTTSMRQTTEQLISTPDRLKKLSSATKWLVEGGYGAVIVSYTRKAVNNIRHAVVEELKPHTITLHKLLEFQPVFYEIEDPAKPGFFKKTMRFEPTRNATNPLPAELEFVAFEESSMIGTDLYKLLQDAMPHPHQEVFLGDIQQLPPIFGPAVLGYKMLELKVVELTEVYRQALESPIIDLAWKILEGNPHEFSSKTIGTKTHSAVLKREVTRYTAPALDKFSVQKPGVGEVKFQIWQKSLSSDHGLLTATKQFNAWADAGYYNPQEDIILCPYNKAFGTIELNKGIAQHLGIKRDATVYEIIAGFNKHYFAVGDRVLYDKEDAFIESISKNGSYLGARTQAASKHLDRWGHLQEPLSEQEMLQEQAEEGEFNTEALEKLMNSAAAEIEERTQAASHIITLRFPYGDGTITLDSASEINNLLGGYAITVHKAQGSEYDKVFFVMHNTHAVMNQRELLYTAVTRAKKFLHIICETDTFEKGIKSQKIKGNTIAEKAEQFKGKDTNGTKPEKNGGKITIISGKKAIKLADIVPPERAKQAQENLEKYWTEAKQKFGDKVGDIPKLNFNIRGGNALGYAYYKLNEIRLNPVWLSVDDPIAIKEMLEDTIIHEICHFVAKRVYSETGHGAKWKFCMLKMGVPSSRLCTVPLPPYFQSKQELLRAVLLKHGATMEETSEPETDEVIS